MIGDQRSKSEQSMGLRKKIALTLLPPVLLVSISLFAEPDALRIFNFGIQLDSNGSAELSELSIEFDAGQSPQMTGNKDVISITNATLNLKFGSNNVSYEYETRCPGGITDTLPTITGTLPTITGTLSLCGPIVQTNGDEFTPDVWKWQTLMVPSVVITDTQPSDTQPITVTLVVSDPTLDLIAPGVVISNTDGFLPSSEKPDTTIDLFIDFGNGISRTGIVETATTIIPDLDSDGDGVPNGDDVCPGTVIPESVPGGLGKNRWALINPDGYFTQAAPQSGSRSVFTIFDTRGCSCEQIADALPGRRKGIVLFGCPTGMMHEWIYTPPDSDGGDE